MPEAADENETFALREALVSPLLAGLVDRRDKQDARFGREPVQELLLDRAHHERDIGLAHQREFLVALGHRGAPRAAARLEIGEALLAQEMQVHGIEHDQRMRRESAQGVEVFDRDVVPRHHDDAELAAARIEKVRDGLRIGREHDFDAGLLQLRDVGLAILEVVGDEGDLAAQLDEQLAPSRPCAATPRPGPGSACTRR